MLILIAILAFLKWNQIDKILSINLGFRSEIDWGSLLTFLIIGIIANLLITFNYVLPIDILMKKGGVKSNSISNAIYFLIILGISVSILVILFSK